MNGRSNLLSKDFSLKSLQFQYDGHTYNAKQFNIISQAKIEQLSLSNENHDLLHHDKKVIYSIIYGIYSKEKRVFSDDDYEFLSGLNYRSSFLKLFFEKVEEVNMLSDFDEVKKN